MKKLLLLAFLILGFQNSIGQEKYEKLWSEVEKYELEGKFRSASELVDKINKKAKRSKNSQQIVRGYIYQSKFALLLDENAQVNIVSELEAAIKDYNYPVNAILESFYAGMLDQYLDKNKYKIRRRTKLQFPNSSDNFEMWDTQTFTSEIAKHFAHSISDESQLKDTSIEDFQAILTHSRSSSKYRPTLYDFLAQRAIDYYKYENQYGGGAQEPYYFSDPIVFAPTIEFINEKFNLVDSINSNVNIILLYQKLEKFHSDIDRVAYIDVVLDRLKFSRENSILENKDSLYIRSLESLSKKFINDEVSAIIKYQLADYYFQESNQENAKNDSLLKHYRIKSYVICEKVLEEFPNSDGGLLCKILKSKIVKETVTITTEKNLIPNKPFLAKVQFKGIDGVYITTYQVPSDFLETYYTYKRDSVILDLVKIKTPKSVDYFKLQANKDYYEYTTEISIPGLPKGSYLIVASTSQSVTSYEDVFEYDLVNSTDLAMLSIGNDNDIIRLLNRETGFPLKNVQINAYKNDSLIDSGVTNEFGDFRFKKQKNYLNGVAVHVNYKGDTLIRRNYYLSGSHSNYEESEQHIAKTTIVLDRGIYRPGQTIYFKGFLTERKNGESRVVPDVNTAVIIYDANGDELKEFRLKTNEYGSISGEYKLPQNVLTGEFSIEMDEDYGDDENDADPYWDEIDDLDYGEKSFSVEEYKRPKFEVEFDEITGNYKMGDSISVFGNAKAFLGSTVSNAKVKYHISRTILNSFDNDFYYEGNHVIKNGETLTDEQGNFTIRYIALPDSLHLKKDKPTYSYTVNATVTDINGESQSAEKKVFIGFHNIKVAALMDTKMNSQQPQGIRVKTDNLNNQPIDAKVDVSIYKLVDSQRILRKRPWDIVELKTIPRDTFLVHFPHEIYDEADGLINRTKEVITLHKNFNTSETDIIDLGDISSWKSGDYVLELQAIDQFKDTLSITKNFEIYNPNDTYVLNNKLIDYEILNTEFKNDGEAVIKLKTPAVSLSLMVEGYYKGEEIYKKNVILENHHSILKIPVNSIYKDKIDISLSFVKFNSFFRKNFSLYLPETTNELTINTLSFRNKLIPDQPETWSFKITNVDGAHAEAEILASMYDTSLDNFVSHNWNTKIGIKQYSYYGVPGIRDDGSFDTTKFKNFTKSWPRNTTTFLKNYHNLNWFGFNFGNVNSSNKRYLNILKLDVRPDKIKEGNISGIIMDETGLPLPGVNVIVKGTDVGTQSDFDGYYSINAPIGAELVFSYVGFISESVVVNKSTTINHAMTEDAALLEEVVVTGYGVGMEKKALSFSVSLRTERRINDSLVSLLAGKLSGVEIVENNELLGLNSMVVIRGMASVNSANQSLIIIDGVPINAEGFNADGYNLNTTDIESIDILKGEKAITLYGSRGNNGVIIITTKKGLEELAQVEARDDLKETAFFFPHLTTDQNGEVSFNFTSPQALTKWRLMLMAHTKKLDIGYLEKLAITQKDLNVVPNVPRFLREKDTIIISAKLSNLTTQPIAGVSLLMLYDGITMNPIEKGLIEIESTKKFTIAPKGNAMVSWKLIIPEGLQVLQYKIVAKSGNHTDGESGQLPVLSNRVLITEAKPLWVRSGTTKKIEFDNLKNIKSTTLRNHKFTLEYTSNPAWLAIKSLPYLMEFPHECAEQTFARFYSNALAATIVQNNPKIKDVFESWKMENFLESPLEQNDKLKSILISETPWVRDAASETENKSRIANLFDTSRLIEQQNLILNKLNELQLSSGGFPWFSGGRENEFITRHIVAGFGHLQKLNTDFDNPAKITATLNKAINYLDIEFHKDFREQVRNQSDSTKVHLTPYTIQYLYARSFFLQSHEPNRDLQRVLKIYLQECKKSWLTTSLYEKGMISLVLYRMNEIDEAKKIVEALIEQAVQSDENGMYWKENSNSWHWYKSPIETQALLIEAVSEIDYDKDIIDKLKLWLIKNKQTNQWSTTKATTEAIYALLMQGSDWLSVADNTIITIGDEKIKTNKLKSSKKEAETGYLNINWNENEIDSKMATIKVNNKSDVVGYGGVYWQYFEDLDNIKRTGESPLHLKKSVFLHTNTTDGPELKLIQKGTQIQLGDLITIRIEITSKNDMEFVHLKDLRASGLEPVDVLSEYKWQDGLGYYQSTKDVATHFFFDQLPKGTYIFEYNLRANNSGNFSNGITTIQSMYAPEFADHSEGVRIEIMD
jgi:TonB-dependent SusC/RagA subfamily outer membrane receptor